MCIFDSGKLFAEAAYQRYGVSLHNVESGKIIWTNKEIKRINSICFSSDGKLLWSAENNPEEHYIHLAYCSDYDYILCFGYKFGDKRKKPFDFLDVYSAESDTLIYSSAIGSIDHAYSDPEHIVIDATGKVFEVGRDSCVLSSRRFKVSSAFNSKKKSL
ncbi:MAG: hypothetical protein K5697_10160 [Lachnospiraceae bacterium]|nr:hypothetical protein [Lachnospiraceae bacterium]